MYPFRTIFKNQIICEFFPPERKSKKTKVIIFCPGSPGLPGKTNLIKFLSQKGYWAFDIRYRGSWESKGEFLNKSPHIDVRDVIDELTKGFSDVWNGEKFKLKPDFIAVIGVSFGGPAALLSSMDKRVDKVIAVSSVIDWLYPSEEDPVEEEFYIYKNGYPGAYRLPKKNWNKILSGKFYNPLPFAKKLDGSKILVVHSQDDGVCSIEPTKKFVELTGAKFKKLRVGGHGLKITEARIWKHIDKFLKN